MTKTVEITITTTMTITAPPDGTELMTSKPECFDFWFCPTNHYWFSVDCIFSSALAIAYAVKKKPVKHSVWVALYADGAAVMNISGTLEYTKSSYPSAIEYREITWEVSA